MDLGLGSVPHQMTFAIRCRTNESKIPMGVSTQSGDVDLVRYEFVCERIDSGHILAASYNHTPTVHFSKSERCRGVFRRTHIPEADRIVEETVCSHPAIPPAGAIGNPMVTRPSIPARQGLFLHRRQDIHWRSGRSPAKSEIISRLGALSR